MTLTISTELIKKLRAETGAGVLDSKRALEANDGDFDKAVAYLREKGLATAAKKAGREAKDGLIGYYVHPGARLAAMVELNCETDFVARTEGFQTLAKDLSMHVVAARPLYVRREDIPAEVLDELRANYQVEFKDSGKPDNIIERIVDGKLEKHYQEVCLLEQPFIKDDSLTVGDVVTQAVAKLGENIVVRRFARFEVGD
jgi:elongation factor Ts